MIYGSVCSGIEAATMAWHGLGWRPAFFSEIEPFPRAVLAHRHPDVPCHGDFTTMQGGEYGAIDLLVGGTPCQDFSIAGLRAGMAGERGNLTLKFLRLVARAQPRWVVWENVPGVLSIGGGRAFGAVLGALADLGYGFAYRVLDAQYFGLAQRRARVFVVGCLGDWRRAAAVLFEPESLLGHPAPSRQAGQRVARPIASSSPRSSGYRNDADTADNLIAGAVSSKWAKGTGGPAGDECYNLVAAPQGTFAQDVADPIAANQPRTYTREGTHNFRTSNVVAVENVTAFSCKDSGQDFSSEVAPTLRGMSEVEGNANAGGQIAVAFSLQQLTSPGNRSNPKAGDPAPTLAGHLDEFAVASLMAVRRLTPRECERLQGFPDDYTLVPYRKKPAKDGPRYKALGNSMAVPVMAWIGQRINMMEGA
jgi:DNA (cytosine-5)-methyltransferase 1